MLLLTLGEIFGGSRYETLLRPKLYSDDANPTPSAAIRALATAAFPTQIGQLELQGAPSWNTNGQCYEARYLTADGKKISYSVWPNDTNEKQMLGVMPADRPNVLFETKNLRIQYHPEGDDLTLKSIVGPDYIFAVAPSTASINDLANNLSYAALGSVKPAKPIDVKLPPASALAHQTSGKADEDVDRQVRRIQAALVERWFSLQQVDVSAGFGQVDPTTLHLSPTQEFSDVDDMDRLASNFKTALGKQLKDAGIRRTLAFTRQLTPILRLRISSFEPVTPL